MTFFFLLKIMGLKFIYADVDDIFIAGSIFFLMKMPCTFLSSMQMS